MAGCNLTRTKLSIHCAGCDPFVLGQIYPNSFIEPIKFVEDYISSTGQRASRVQCLCHYEAKGCKEIFVACVSKIKNGNTKSCGCLQRNVARKPEGTHVSPRVIRYYHSTEYRKMQNEVFDRDKNCCVVKGNLLRKFLTLHHKKPRRIIWEENNIKTWKDVLAYKELWDLDNAVTISEEWHLGIKISNPNALHRTHHGKTYVEENYYSWLKETLASHHKTPQMLLDN